MLLLKIKNILQFSLNLILLDALWLQDISASLTIHCTMLISSTWWLPVMYSKDDRLINKYCSLEINNITGPTANCLDQGSWATSVEKPTQMEIRCTAHTQVMTINPPLTFVTLQPACSAFSPEIKLPPYFKQYSKGFEIAIKTAKLIASRKNIIYS